MVYVLFVHKKSVSKRKKLYYFHKNNKFLVVFLGGFLGFFWLGFFGRVFYCQPWLCEQQQPGSARGPPGRPRPPRVS